jgi:chromatin structure-remodeling complex subunit SFH1
MTALETQAHKRVSLVPIRVEFETETHRIRDCFVWNLNETLITPENFAKVFCTDIGVSAATWADTVTNQIRAQLEEHEGIASMNLGGDAAPNETEQSVEADENPECRVIISVCTFLIISSTGFLIAPTDRRAGREPPPDG